MAEVTVSHGRGALMIFVNNINSDKVERVSSIVRTDEDEDEQRKTQGTNCTHHSRPFAADSFTLERYRFLHMQKKSQQ